MNAILRKILGAAKDIALQTATEAVPGAGIAISGATKLFDKDNSNNAEGLSEIESGVISAVRGLDPSHVSNATLVAEGVTELEDGFRKVRAGLKTVNPTPALS
jgi:hypothetical protein